MRNAVSSSFRGIETERMGGNKSPGNKKMSLWGTARIRGGVAEIRLYVRQCFCTIPPRRKSSITPNQTFPFLLPPKKPQKSFSYLVTLHSGPVASVDKRVLQRPNVPHCMLSNTKKKNPGCLLKVFFLSFCQQTISPNTPHISTFLKKFLQPGLRRKRNTWLVLRDKPVGL